MPAIENRRIARNRRRIAWSAGFGAVFRARAGFSSREWRGDSFNCLDELRNDRIATCQGELVSVRGLRRRRFGELTVKEHCHAVTVGLRELFFLRFFGGRF